ncbi:transposase [Aeromonas caviae]|uniref:Transposase n=1 Tax=Aeromonas caviae TaxID=648 RepID=A0AAI9P8W6_AERCA|nr:DNA-binding protein [Aeromonas caviae]GJA53279.1 transposase [Aeromonas caviae]
MNKLWFSVQELVGLDGLPSTAFGVRKKADSEGWESRKKEKGKGFEYHLASLPQVTQQALAKQQAKALLQASDSVAVAAKQMVAKLEAEEQVEQTALQARKSDGLVQFNSLPEVRQERATAKMAILSALDAFVAPYSMAGRKVDGIRLFIDAYNQRQLDLPEWVAAHRQKLSQPTLYRWLKKREQEGIVALAGAYKVNRPHLVDTFPRMAQFLVAVLTAKPHLASKAHTLQALVTEQARQEQDWVVPSPSSLRRWVSKWLAAHSAEFAFMTDPDGYNSRHRPVYQKMYQRYGLPNDVWEFDSTPVDVQLNVGGKLKRYTIIGAIDVMTRRAQLLLCPTSDSDGICLLLRQCLLSWGLPNEHGICKTDNGSDYVSKRTTGIFDLLGIRLERAKAFSGWEKPFIERFFRTMSHGLMELLPGYIGHNVSDRKKIEAVRAFCERIGKNRAKGEKEALELALTPEQLEQALSDWLEFHYHHQPHRGLDDLTPFQAYQQSGYQPRLIPEVHALDQLLQHVGDATVVRGKVSAGGLQYTAPELMAPEWARRRVRVFLNPTNVGRATLYPLDDWGRYVEAINDELVGTAVAPDEFRTQRKAATKALRNFRRESKRLGDEFEINDVAARILAAKKHQNQSLVGLPLGSREHDNAAILGLSQAAQAASLPSEPSFSDSEREALARRREQDRQLMRQQEEGKAKLLRDQEANAWFLSRKALIEPLTDTQAAWLAQYRKDYYLVARRIDFTLRQEQEAKAQGQ